MSDSDAIIVKGIDIDSDVLIETNVPDETPALWASGVTYTLDALASIAQPVVGSSARSNTVRDIYRSLQNGNTGHDPEASPAWWVKVGEGYENYDPAKQYQVGDIVYDPVSNRLQMALLGLGAEASLNLATGYFRFKSTEYQNTITLNYQNGRRAVQITFPNGGGPAELPDNERYMIVDYAANFVVYGDPEFGMDYMRWHAADASLAPITITSGTGLVDAVVWLESVVGRPLTDAAAWADVGVPPALYMFDEKKSSQTVWRDKIEVELAIPGRIDTVAFLNVEAADVSIVMFDGATQVCDETVSLVSTDNVDDWYDWFFAPIERRSDYVFSGLPNVLDPMIVATATGSGDVKVGMLLIGTAETLGSTERGASFGIVDYSKVETSELGRTTLNQRGYVKRSRAEIWVEKDDVDQVGRLLASYRATPALFIASSAYTSLIEYGLVRDWSVAISYPLHSILSLEFQGI